MKNSENTRVVSQRDEVLSEVPIVDPPSATADPPGTSERQRQRIAEVARKGMVGYVAGFRRELLRAALAEIQGQEHLERRWSYNSAMADILNAGSHADKETIIAGIQDELDLVEASCSVEDQFDAMRAAVEAAASQIDPKARLMFGLLFTIWAVDGVTQIRWPAELMQSFEDGIEEGCRTFGDDPHVKTLVRAYRLAQRITGEDEGEADVDEVPALDTGPTVEPAATTEGTGRQCTLDKAHPELKQVVGWMLAQPFRVRLAAILMNALLLHETSIKEDGQYKGDIGNDIIKDWENDVLLAAGNAEYLNSVGGIEAALVGYTAALVNIPE
jgi:hypothetical protein